MLLRKLIYSIFLIPLVFTLSTKLAWASLVTIDNDGKVILNVLSAEKSSELEIPHSDYLEIRNIISEATDPNAKISLARVEGKATLNVSTASGDKSLDVSNYKEEVVEVEERPQTRKLTIFVTGDKFTIGQEDILAETEYEINIDPQTARLTLLTPSGLRFLSVLPREATFAVLRSNFINKVDTAKKLVLTETDGELTYEVFGDKVINFFNVYKYPISISARVSASTGEVLSIDGPSWVKIFNFLFV